MSTQTSTTLEPYGTFPPVTPGDWCNMFYDSPLVINRDAAEMVYDVCWFLVKDEAEALRLTVITFRIAVSCLLYTSPSPRDRQKSRMPSSA